MTNDFLDKNISQNLSDADACALISRALNEIGIAANLKGYNFLRVCVNLKRRDPSFKSKEMFRVTAQKFGTNENNVNSGVHHALKTAWQSGKIKNLNSRFGVDYFDCEKQMSNFKFISVLADLINIFSMKISDKKR